MMLPAKLRARFDNNPEKFVEYVGKGENREEAIELGLIPRPPLKDDDTLPPTAAAPKGKDPLSEPLEGQKKGDKKQ
jgi:hypothetical protein